MKNCKSVIPFLVLFILIAIGFPTISHTAAKSEVVHIKVTYENSDNIQHTETLQANLNN